MIVDDEQPARERLKQLLAGQAEVRVVAEASDGEEAVDLIQRLRPDLVFLDIQMPGLNGLEVAEALPSPRPRIIFCTAYDQYAVDAFEMRALDYLLKPVSRARLRESLRRVRESPPDEEALSRTAGELVGTRRFLARHSGRFVVIPETEVQFFGTEEGLTKVRAGAKEFWLDPSLTDLEKRLDPNRFFRISRAAIVRLDAIRQVAPLMGGHGQVLLKDGSRLDVSRRRMKELLERLEG